MTIEPPNTIGPTIAILFCSYAFPRVNVKIDIKTPPAIAAIIPAFEDDLSPVLELRNSSAGTEIDIKFTTSATRLIFALRFAKAATIIASEYEARDKKI